MVTCNPKKMPWKLRLARAKLGQTLLWIWPPFPDWPIIPRLPFLGKLVPKYQDCQFKLKFGTETKSNMQNSMVMFTYSIFDRKYPFWVNLVQKIKIVSLSWNLARRLIRVWTTQWWHSLFMFLTENTLFRQIWSKSQNYRHV